MHLDVLLQFPSNKIPYYKKEQPANQTWCYKPVTNIVVGVAVVEAGSIVVDGGSEAEYGRE